MHPSRKLRFPQARTGVQTIIGLGNTSPLMEVGIEPAPLTWHKVLSTTPPKGHWLTLTLPSRNNFNFNFTTLQDSYPKHLINSQTFLHTVDQVKIIISNLKGHTYYTIQSHYQYTSFLTLCSRVKLRGEKK
ncbi:hypothetical protein Hanom_Chr01g00076591 [Helianthus anomalus]